MKVGNIILLYILLKFSESATVLLIVIIKQLTVREGLSTSIRLVGSEGHSLQDRILNLFY